MSGSDLKYVLIEMIENDVSKMSGNSIIAGIFKGVRVYDPPGKDMLVIIEEDKDNTFLLNTNKFNVLSLQKFDGYTKIIHCWRAVEEDQDIALNMLSNIVKELNEAGRTLDNDDNIIDTTTYTCVPDDVKIIKNSNAAGNATTSRDIYAGSTNCHKQCNGARSKTVVKTDPEPKAFKRTRKPSENALEKMQRKINEIKAGTYQIKLPIVKGDDPKAANADDDCNDNGIYDSNFYVH